MLNVLLTAAGRRVELLRCLQRDLLELGIKGKVIAADASPLTSAGLRADAFVIVPSAGRPNYVEVLSDVIRAHHVGLLVPTIDTELRFLSEAAERLGKLGASVLVSGPLTVDICGDKRSTYRFLVERGLPRPHQWSAADAREEAALLPYPVIVKPRRGSSSVGVVIVTEPACLERIVTSDEQIVQSLAPGEEYTVDIWIDRSGEVRSVVPRRRIEVRAGEVSKGVTEKNSMVIDLARSVADGMPDAYGPLTVQIFADATQAQVIEINARLGGGYPLSWHAGARTTLWAIQDALKLPYGTGEFAWRDRLVMLRHDESVYIYEGDLPQ